jgi:Electron transfer DM13
MARTGQDVRTTGPGGRRRWTALVAAHPLVSTGVAVALLAGLVVVLALYQPQKLFIEITLDEALPSAATAAPSPTSVPAAVAPTPTSVPAGPREVAAGELRGLAHRGSGQVRLLALADGARVGRLEGLDVENGPDLHVYLAEAPADTDPAQFGRRFVDLGLLKANHGNQNYRLPADADSSRFRRTVIWCKRFAVGFAVAPLAPA